MGWLFGRHGNGELHVTLCCILDATRFKFFGGGRGNSLSKTRCTICGGEDSWPHLRSHCDARVPLIDVEKCVEYLVSLAICADRINPHIPVPMVEMETQPETVAGQILTTRT